MQTSRRTILAGLAASAFMASPARAQSVSPSFAGVYTGTLAVGPARLRLRLEIKADGSAVLTSVDQGNAQIAAKSVTVRDNELTLDFPDIGASYKAKLATQGGLDGVFMQAGMATPLALARGEGHFTSGPPEKQKDIKVEPLTLPILQAARLKTGTPGMAAAWQKKGSKPRILVDGARSSESANLVTAADQWHLGSITKSMTAFIAARLVEAGRLRWDSRIGAVLGKALDRLHPDFADVTLLQLLSHRSGLKSAAGEAGLGGYSLALSPQIHDERLRFVGSVLSQRPAIAPGKAFAYVNAGYVTAAAMMEQVTGKTWETLIAEHVFAPLKLASAGISLPVHQGKISQPLGHAIASAGKRMPQFQDLPIVLGPAGLTHMNLSDLLTWLAAHRDRPPLLSRENWSMLHTAHFGGSYALGWVRQPDGSLWHNGSTGFWYAEVSIDRAKGRVAAVASNDIANFSSGPGPLLRAAQLAAG